jgi:Heparinase II/III-like protein
VITSSTQATHPYGPLWRLWGESVSPQALVEYLDPQLLANVCAHSVPYERLLEIAPGVRERALADLDRPWPHARATDYSRYFRDGNRTAYETTVRARHERLSRAVVMSMAAEGAGDRTAWLDEVADGVIVFCEQSTWCWAAHDDVRGRRGHVLPDVASPFLDLGAGEVAAQLAWVDLALGNALDDRFPGLRERMRSEVAERIFNPFLSRRDWHWLGLNGDVHNWNPWIHGNVIVAACALADDPATRARIVALSIDGIDRYLASLPADGAIDEGYAYWWNGAARALEALETLEIATGGHLGAAALDLIPALVRFPVGMHVAGPWYVNFADAPARLSHAVPWRTLAHWGRIAGEDTVVAHAGEQAATLEPAGETVGLGRLVLALADADWPPARGEKPTAPPPSLWLGSVQIMVARAGDTQRAIVVAAKGGHNAEHHNHKDVGSFTVAVDGTPVLVDAGQPTYTAQTFGSDRYSIRAMQSGWHSTPAPWGLEQALGREAAATSAFHDDGSIAETTFDLSRVYPLPDGSRWTRVVRLGRADAVAVAVAVAEDQWLLPWVDSTPYDGVLIHHLVHGEVVITGPSSAVVHPSASSPDRRSVELRWDGAEVEMRVEMWALEDPLLERVWGDHLARLTVAVQAPSTGDRKSAFEGTLRLVVSVVP